MIRIVISFLISMLLSMLAIPGALASGSVTSITQHEDGSYHKLIIESTTKPIYNAFLLDNPHRLVIDIKNFTWLAKPAGNSPGGLVNNIRHGIRDKHDLRIVIDLKQQAYLAKHSIHQNLRNKHYQLIVQLQSLLPIAARPKPPVNKPAALPYDKNTALGNYKPKSIIPTTAITPSKTKQLPVIVIDPGHGGKHPGTTGRKFPYHEKDITLAYALSLKYFLEKQHSYKIVLTRQQDKFLSLAERVELTEKAGADLFISLHADANTDTRMKGASVYTLSDQASDDLALKLAEEENKSDIARQSDHNTETNEVTSLLIDLARRDTNNKSVEFANLIIQELQKNVHILKTSHRSAGFKVLKARDVPSVLIELGYLSNLKEEALLNNAAYKAKIVTALAAAIDRHFAKRK